MGEAPEYSENPVRPERTQLLEMEAAVPPLGYSSGERGRRVLGVSDETGALRGGDD